MMKLLSLLLLTIYLKTIKVDSAPSPITRYIVKLKPHVLQNKVDAFFRGGGGARTLDVKINAIKHRFKPSFFNGFVGDFTSDFLSEFTKAHGPDVEYIERDKHVWRFGTQSKPPSWGLTRIAEHWLKEKDYYDYPDQAGQGVTVYIADTGVNAVHDDFGGRAKTEVSFIEEEELTDLNGHGTHCAGTIGSATYGVAKKTLLRGVKVLNSEGSGAYSAVIAGIEYVASKVIPGKTVLSMSLGGEKSKAIDDAVKAAYEKGVVVIVAAGNEGIDACECSPAGASEAFAVGAVNSQDKVASFSNTGDCVKIYAPGVDITSLWKGSSGATETISGTSMACPHVAGVAALFMSAKNYTKPDEVYADLLAYATMVEGLDKKLLFNKLDKSTSPPPKKPVDPDPEPEFPKHPTKPDDPEPKDPDDPLSGIFPGDPIHHSDPSDPDDPEDPLHGIRPTNPSDPTDPDDPDRWLRPDPVHHFDPSDPDDPLRGIRPTEPTDPDPDRWLRPDPVHHFDPSDPDDPLRGIRPTNPTDPDDPLRGIRPSDPIDIDDPNHIVFFPELERILRERRRLGLIPPP